MRSGGEEKTFLSLSLFSLSLSLSLSHSLYHLSLPSLLHLQFCFITPKNQEIRESGASATPPLVLL